VTVSSKQIKHFVDYRQVFRSFRMDYSEPPVCTLHATPTWDLASRYSSWPKLLRTTALYYSLYRFLNRFRRSKKPANTATLLPEEIQNAKCYWLKTMLSNMFPNENALKHKRLVSKNSPIFVLNPYMDKDGLIRIRGRLRRVCLPGATRNPIVLHPLLILIQHHQRCMPILN